MSEHITREQANELLHKYVKGENYITHSYAVEAIMRGLAKKLAPDEIEFWGICGLLHDLDEETADWRTDMSTHGPVSAQILKDEGYDEPVMAQAICCLLYTSSQRCERSFCHTFHVCRNLHVTVGGYCK